MSGAASKPRRRTGWLPLSDPNFAAPEYRRVGRLAFYGSMAVWIPVYFALSLSVTTEVLFTVSLGVALLVAGIAYLALQWWLLRRRLWAASQAVAWHNDRATIAWGELDGGTFPADPDAALARIGERQDRLATWLRAAWLAHAGRIDALRALVERWRPSDPVDAARHAIAVAELEYRANSIDDLGPARTAAATIADSSERAQVLSLIELRDAWRRGDRFEDPFPSLVAARRALGPAGDVAQDKLVAWRRATLRRVLAYAALIAISTPIALVLGAWWVVLAVALGVVAVRATSRRVRLSRAGT